MDVFNFVVSEGAIIHAHRYAAVLRDLGVSTAELQRLRIQLADVAGTRRGVLEVRGGSPSLALRPLAPAPTEITVQARPVRDERTQPGRIGPDVGWQQQQLARIPAHEGLLIDATGHTISAIMHPLIVVESGRASVSTHPDSPRSVELEAVVEMLRGHGVEVAELAEGFDTAALTDKEVWVVDPVYGVRMVDTWLEYGTKRPAPLLFDRGGVPSHREINEERRRLAAVV